MIFTEAQIRSLLEFDTLNNSSLTALVENILPLTGIDDNDLFKIFGTSNRALLVLFLSDSLKILIDAGLPLPNWAHKIYPEPLLSLLSKSVKTIYVGSLDQIRYLEGELFQELVGLMQSKANNTLSPDRRVYYYSGHDYTIMGLLAMLNPQREAYVNPGSALIYELHQNPRTGQFTVEVT
ncbi:uncharacterized protein LOC124361332 [Homalodisca vitripennis]|uniref:uncharacterized protein LOC124361332 n=1 Tax=Homalodisca vitripennis TaxID=197043 RepID=UPI001EE9E487|nr:uncharacterized protein LOC124361332 [Homalodisca vitripennis]